MKFSVCADSVFSAIGDLPERIAKVAEAGFHVYEFWSWWGRDPMRILKAQRDCGMQCAALCTRFIPLTDPARRAEYLEGLRETADVAKLLGCRVIISQVGNLIDGVCREKQFASIVDGMKDAAGLLEKTGMTLVIEPLNDRRDHPGYFLVESSEGFRAIDDIASGRIRLLFDIYHQQMSCGHLIDDIIGNIDKIGHMHAAGCPGRGTILRGEINYREVFAAIESSGYRGYVGLEYFPKEDAFESLVRIREAFPEYVA